MIRRIFILAALAYLLYWLVKRSLRRPSPQRRQGTGETGDETVKVIDGGEMVKDPFCQSYYPKKKAIRQKIDGEIHYFCSEDCLRKYMESVKSGIPQGR